MNKIIKICVFLFVGCLFSACHSNDDEMVVNAEDGFTQADIANLKAMKQQMQEATEEIAVPMQRAIRRSRATTGEEELTEEETAVLRSRLKLAGTQAVASFNNLGISTAELNDIYRIDGNEELYGMVGISLANGMEFVEVGDQTLIRIDYGKAVGCLFDALGLSIKDITLVLSGLGLCAGANDLTKAQLTRVIKKTIVKLLPKVTLKMAGGALTAADILIEWSWCYWDLPSWKDIIKDYI